jgi:hypothetical protein
MFTGSNDGLLCAIFRQQITGRQRCEVGNVVCQMQHKLFTRADHLAGDGKTVDIERRAGGWQLPLQQALQQRQPFIQRQALIVAKGPRLTEFQC